MVRRFLVSVAAAAVLAGVGFVTGPAVASADACSTVTAVVQNCTNQVSVTASAPLTISATTADTTPPSVPTGLNARINCSLDFTLRWTASTDNVGVVGYDIYRTSYGGTFTPAGTSTTTTFSGHLNGFTQYEVRARDAAGNVSAFTAPVSVVPPPCPTSPGPSVTSTPTPTPSVPNTPGCTASVSVVTSWPGGFQGQVTITNTGSTATTSWTATLTLGNGQRLTQIWSALTSSTASPYVVTNQSWNGVLAPGASAWFGFQASSTGTGGSATATCTRTP